MALIVEDGTGKADAESYASVAQAAEYAGKMGFSFTGDTPDLEAALRRATVWVDGQYRSRFLGYRRLGRLQGLEWPRYNAYVSDAPYSIIPSDEVPHEVIDATIEAAKRELASPGSLSPDVTTGKIQKSVSVEGAVSIEYAIGGGTAFDQRPTMTVIDDILAPVLGRNSAGGLFGKASRS